MPPKTLRICVDADCPACGWGERWADVTTDLKLIKEYGCNKCTYRSQHRDR
ncbi:hypothetical protein [Nocardia asiatica]|uniref:hypothetical protein n=1 Tax=Nocardia asiatica TaxID=209252 RepID=UPI002458A0C0|nr:hypothetical protein [Nocardia asiatica]